MRTAWRIVKKQYAATAFDGEGSRLYGGRWNSPGQRPVYVAGARSLAALEMLVHLDRVTLLESFVLIPCDFSESLVVTVDRVTLPARWRRYPAPSELAAIGDEWIQSARSAVLAVPSVVIEDEINFLLNPAHPDFRTISIGVPERFEFDERLVK